MYRRYSVSAIRICVFTAFSVRPKNFLIRRFCFIVLKNISMFHLARYIPAIYPAVRLNMFVRIVISFPVFSSTDFMTRRGNGHFLPVCIPVNSIVRSSVMCLFLLSCSSMTRYCAFSFSLVTKKILSRQKSQKPPKNSTENLHRKAAEYQWKVSSFQPKPKSAED